MSNYIESVFDVLDGKLTYNKIGKKKRGRKAGYKHSVETKHKIAEKMKNRTKTPEIRSKISKSLLGRSKPDEVKEKISKSKTKHTIAEDLINQYSGYSKEKDIPTPTSDYLDKHNHKKSELCKWIKDNFEVLNESSDYICTESHLKALSIKEETLLDQDFNYIKIS